MCLHGALSSVPINLICNMTTFRKKCLTLHFIPGVKDVCKDKMCACMCLHSSLI